jgi:hypothetical protein
MIASNASIQSASVIDVGVSRGRSGARLASAVAPIGITAIRARPPILAAALLSCLMMLAALSPRAAAQCLAGWIPSAGAASTDGYINAFVVLPDGEVIAGGSFTMAGGVSANRIARYNPVTGVWTPLGSGVDGLVFAVATLAGGDVVAGGTITTAGGVAANHIARYNSGTGAWSALGAGLLGTGLGNSVLALAVPSGGHLIAGGNFTMSGGVSANRIARYNPFNEAWSSLGGGLNGNVNAAASLPGGEVIVGGLFTAAGGRSANRIARCNPVTGTWFALGSGLDRPVLALAVLPGGDVIAGGDFISAGGIAASYIARCNPTTGAWSALGSGVNGSVSALAVLPGGDVIAGGRFTVAGGVAANRIARYNPTTGVWSALGSGVNNLISALAVLPGGDVIAGGSFTMAGGVPSTYFARYSFGSFGPRITDQPADRSGCGVTGASFEVAAAGTGTLTYQWRKNGIAISPVANPSAATATLVINPVSAVDAGAYDVVVADACGSITSNAATLTVCTPQTVIRVRASAPAGGNGQSWSTAYNDLMAALAAVPAGAEVWVAAGTYVSTSGFTIPSGRAIYGGFAGTETQRGERDPASRITTLSAANLSTVVIMLNNSSETVVDGFTITDGRTTLAGQRGGGVRIEGGAPRLRGCTITNCSGGVVEAGAERDAGVGGGGLYISGGAAPLIENCVIRSNSGGSGISPYSPSGGRPGGNGGGAYVVDGAMPQFVDCVFDSNSTGSGAGECVAGFFFSSARGRAPAIFVTGASLAATRCTFTRHFAPNGTGVFVACNRNYVGPWDGYDGGAIISSSSNLTLTGCIFHNNRAGVGGDSSSAGNGARPGSRGGSGGAIIGADGSITIDRCVFAGNSAGRGGSSLDYIQPFTRGGDAGNGSALHLTGVVAVIRNSLFIGNTCGAGGPGGQAPNTGLDGADGQGTVYSTSGSLTIRNCTVAYNTTAGATAGFSAASADIANSILYFNTGAGTRTQAAQTDSGNIRYSCIQGITPQPGSGNISLDPNLAPIAGPDGIVGTPDDDARLLFDSPCIDAASNPLYTGSNTDLLGLVRFLDDPATPDTGAGPSPVIDMGAVEYAPCIADLDDGSSTGTRDGGVTLDDLVFYLNLFAAGASRADIDDGSSTGTPDGSVTIDDLLYFLARYNAGC